MYKIIPFKIDHIDCMDIREHEMKFNKEMLAHLEGKMSITGVIDGRVISCGGITPYSDTAAILWQLPSIYVEQYAVPYARFIRKWLDETADNLGIKRMETACIDDRLHNRWMQFLGFEKEGVKKQYLFGLDYSMWGKLWD